MWQMAKCGGMNGTKFSRHFCIFTPSPSNLESSALVLDCLVCGSIYNSRFPVSCVKTGFLVCTSRVNCGPEMIACRKYMFIETRKNGAYAQAVKYTTTWKTIKRSD